MQVLQVYYVEELRQFEGCKTCKILSNVCNMNIALLFQQGMQRQYELGQFLRKRYVQEFKLLSTDYDERQVSQV